MSKILKRYCPRTEFSSYEDFFENYVIEYPKSFNFAYDVVDEWARLEPDKLALVWTNDTDEVRRYTFSDIKRESDKAANAFAELGISKGDIVMLILKQRPEAWFYMVALCKIGAVCIPSSYQLTHKDIEYRANVANIKMLVTVNDEGIINNIKQALPDCPGIQLVGAVGDCPSDPRWIDFRSKAQNASADFTRRDMQATDNMLIYFSSGTTGMPKMVLHDNHAPLGHIVTAKYWQCVEENHIHMTQTDSGWAKFAWGKIYGQWICGAAVGAYDTEKFVPGAMLEAMARIKPRTFCAPATIYRVLIKEDLDGYDFSYIAHASLAGEPLNPEVYNKIYEKTGLKIYEGFGQSEGSVLLANFPWVPIRPGSMGKPAPLYNIDLLDEHSRSCEDGIVGNISITKTDIKHPTGLFMEYYNAPDSTAKVWNHGIYQTGDMAWRDAEGYYWFVGRNDDVIKCSGYRIGPFEVESCLMEHPSVLECAVTAYPDAIRGQVVKATIVLARGFTASDELVKELQNHVKKTTAPYKYPRIVEFVAELPKTVSGKIMRNKIKAADENN